MQPLSSSNGVTASYTATRDCSESHYGIIEDTTEILSEYGNHSRLNISEIWCPNACSDDSASGDSTVHSSSYRPDPQRSSTIQVDPPWSDEDEVRRLGALVMDIQRLHGRSSTLDEFIKTNQDLPPVDKLESEVNDLSGRGAQLSERLMRMDEELEALQRQRAGAEQERQEVDKLCVTIQQQVEDVNARHAKVLSANEQLREVRQQLRERRAELGID